MICTVILAAGRSQRFGGIKLLADWNGVPLVRHAVLSGLNAGTEVLVVTGAHAQEISSALQGLAITQIHNENWHGGMGSSIACAMHHLQAQAKLPSAVILALADQPLLTRADLERLLALHAQNPSKILAAEFSGQHGPPCLFPAQFFGELTHLTGDTGARSLLRRHADQLVSVPMPMAALDVDTPEDFERALRARS